MPITIDDLKLYDGGTMGPAADPVLTLLLAAATTTVAAYCGWRSLYSAEYSEARDGTDGPKLVLANSPVTALSTVMLGTKDLHVITDPLDTQTVGVRVVRTRLLVYNGGKFDKGVNNVAVRYTAGYDDVQGRYPLPDDIKLAVMMLALLRYRGRQRVGVASKSLATESVTWGDASGAASGAASGVPPEIRGLLAPYVNTVPETGG